MTDRDLQSIRSSASDRPLLDVDDTQEPRAGYGAASSSAVVEPLDGGLMGASLQQTPTMVIFTPAYRQHVVPALFTRVFGADQRAKIFRAYITTFLAVLAVLNCLSLLVVWIELDDGPDTRGWSPARTPNGTLVDQARFDDLMRWQSSIQTTVAVLALVAWLFYHVSRNKAWFPSWTCVPRNIAAKRFGVGDVAQLFIWMLHCPIGVAHLNPTLRHIDAFAVLRLYSVGHAAMAWSPSSSPMSRALSHMLGLHLNFKVFIRWSLEYHKWKTLLPVVTLVFAWLAQIFCFAEDVSFFTACYWLTTTITTTGYGDITPKTTTGRTIAMCAMMFGLVVIAYFVKEVQRSLERPVREKRILDIVTRTQMMRQVKTLAAELVQARWRLRASDKADAASDSGGAGDSSQAPTANRSLGFMEKLGLIAKARNTARSLRSLLDQIALLPLPGEGDHGMNALRERVDVLTATVERQNATINEMRDMMRQLLRK